MTLEVKVSFSNAYLDVRVSFASSGIELGRSYCPEGVGREETPSAVIPVQILKAASKALVPVDQGLVMY